MNAIRIFCIFTERDFFRNAAPLDRSYLTRWRQRTGKKKLCSQLLESLVITERTGATKLSRFCGVIVDSTVQPRNITWPKAAKPIYKALEHLVKQTKADGIRLRQNFAYSCKRALKRHHAYVNGKKYNLAKEQLDQPRTCLDSVIREIRRKNKDNSDLQKAFSKPLRISEHVMTLGPREDAGSRDYAMHAPEMECNVKGKEHRFREFGGKVLVVTPIRRPAGGQLDVHVKVLCNNPYDRPTLETVLSDIEHLAGKPVNRVLTYREYRCNHAPLEYKRKVCVTGQQQNMPPAVLKQLRWHKPVEAVTGHAKIKRRMGVDCLAHGQGDAINLLLAVVGCNFRLLLRWVRKNFESFSVEIFSPTDSQNGGVLVRLPWCFNFLLSTL